MEGHIILSLWDQKLKLCISICLWYVFHILLQSHFTGLFSRDFFIRQKLWCLQAFKCILSLLLNEKHDSCNFPNFYYVIIAYLLLDLSTFLVSSQSQQAGSCSNPQTLAALEAMGCGNPLEVPNQVNIWKGWDDIHQNTSAIYSVIPVQTSNRFFCVSHLSHGVAFSWSCHK